MSAKLHVAILFLLAGIPATAQITTAEVSGGRIDGSTQDGISSFKGIPFAAPPVGDFRWRTPQPVPAWQGVKKADAFGPACMQSAMAARVMGASKVSEDCLYLNVWTPAKSPKEKLPVMVWIYGGAFAAGATSVPLYDGTRLAKKGVIMVSIAYRVGAFGFLAHPELSKESGHGSGTYGLQDQIAGLKWIKANIAKFGGDPNNVTIFGESAGAISVSMLAASPEAKGLFAKAISESGGSFAGAQTGGLGGMNVPPLATAEVAGASFFQKLGAADLKSARALPAEKIQAGAGANPLGGMFWPVFDGYVLPQDQYLLYRQGKYNDTPILIGTNADEGAMFARASTPESFESQVRGAYGEKADAILTAYPHATPQEAKKAGKDLFRDSAFAWHTWAWANLQSKTGKSKVFAYYFEHKTPKTPDGASHSDEMPFVFGNPNSIGFGPAFSPDPSDAVTTEQMMSYWTNFAKHGDPNGPGLPVWPTFSVDKAQVLRLAPIGAIAWPNTTQLNALDGYYAWRRSQAVTQ